MVGTAVGSCANVVGIAVGMCVVGGGGDIDGRVGNVHGQDVLGGLAIRSLLSSILSFCIAAGGGLRLLCTTVSSSSSDRMLKGLLALVTR